MSDTIAAIATATGVGSIAIIRVSGSRALDIAYKLTHKESLKVREATLTSLYNKDNNLIDQAIVIYFKSPNSFTGEDIVEFQCHGGLVVAQEILDTTIYHGARLAEPGEFTKRAFFNGKIDLSEAEAIAKMIETKSVDGAKIIARQLKGELSYYVNDIRDKLIKILAHSEVMIDYAEDDIPSDISNNLQNTLLSVKKDLENLLASSIRRRGIIEGFWLAIIGKPNVGKSSILNKMLNYDRAIVSDIAGTTRDSIEEQIKIGSHLVRVADTAGIRDAKDKIEKLGVDRSIKWIEESDIIVAVFDASKSIDKEDEKILNLIKKIKDKYVIVALNKIDKEIVIDTSLFKDFDVVKISAKKSINELLSKIEKLLNTLSKSDELILISNRQIDSVKKAINEVNNSLEHLQSFQLEFFSYHINSAIEALNEITKPYRHEELLDKMFSEFCLGK